MLTFNQKAYCIDVSAEHPALIWIWRKHISRENSDLWWDMGSRLHSRVKAVHCGVTLQGLSTAQKIQDTAVSQKGYSKCVFGFRKSDSCWCSSTWYKH
jgi:hypothetical protein